MPLGGFFVMSIIPTAECLLKIHNDRSHAIGCEMTHQRGLALPIISSVVPSDITTDNVIAIEDHEHGELHLQFTITGGNVIGTFKCDNLKFPTDSNAKGSPSKTVDVTSTKFNDDHDKSEIHIHVR
jgi:hypothetical protein